MLGCADVDTGQAVAADAGMDSFDCKILHFVQREGDLTVAELAVRIGLSPSATARRLRRLKAYGVIRATISLVEPAAIGSPMLFMVGIELDRDRRAGHAALYAWLAQEDRVQQAYYVTGQSDMIAIVCAPDIAAFEEFMARMIQESANIRRYTTNVVSGICKRSFLYPIPPAAKLRARHV